MPVVLWADLPNAVIVSKNSPIRSLPELIEAAQARPGALTFASSGNGTTLHLSGELLKAMAGLDILHIPFRGGDDSVNQLLAGRIDVAFNNLPTALPLIRGGQLRALAVTAGAQLDPARGADSRRAQPAGLCRRVLVRLAGAVAHAGSGGPAAERGGERGARGARDAQADRECRRPAARRHREEIATFIRAENVKWAEVIRRSGARVD